MKIHEAVANCPGCTAGMESLAIQLIHLGGVPMVSVYCCECRWGSAVTEDQAIAVLLDLYGGKLNPPTVVIEMEDE
jgi:hypothetical protein